METENWLVGWKKIGKYLGRSAKTAKQWGSRGMPFVRDPGGRPIAKPFMIDEFIMDMNQRKHDNKVWMEKGIGSALDYEYEKEKMRKEFDERFLLAQRPPRSLF